MIKELRVNADTPSHAWALADIGIGDNCQETHILRSTDFESFAALSGDRAPVHESAAFATGKGFAQRIYPGFLITLRFSRLLGMILPGANSVIHSTTLEYPAAVMITEDGTTLNYAMTVMRMIPTLRAVELALKVSQDDRVVAKGTAICIIKA